VISLFVRDVVGKQTGQSKKTKKQKFKKTKIQENKNSRKQKFKNSRIQEFLFFCFLLLNGGIFTDRPSPTT
jgi:hypothetical protein